MGGHPFHVLVMLQLLVCAAEQAGDGPQLLRFLEAVVHTDGLRNTSVNSPGGGGVGGRGGGLIHFSSSSRLRRFLVWTCISLLRRTRCGVRGHSVNLRWQRVNARVMRALQLHSRGECSAFCIVNLLGWREGEEECLPAS
jgi:hypothetical protein